MFDHAGSGATIIDSLRFHAVSIPAQAAYIFLKDDGSRETVSFQDLARRAEVAASVLAQRFPRGERVMLMLPQSIDYIVAFLAIQAAGLIAVPAFPPRRGRSADRLTAIVASASPAAIVGDPQLCAPAAALGRGRALPIVSIEELSTGGPEACWPTRPPVRIAFLQYTSGSTGDPRGVIVTHHNLLCNSRQMQVRFGHNSDSILASWLPLFHDMGLIGCAVQSLFVGITAVLMSPTSFVLDPLRWLRAASEFRATTIGGPNFAYDLCAQRVSSQLDDLDLRSVRVAFNGSEPVRATTIARFFEAFARYGFRPQAFFPCYGLAEATLFVAGGPAGQVPRKISVSASALEEHQIRLDSSSDSSRVLVSSGAVADGTEVLIVDPRQRTPCGPQTVGEIWVASPSVCEGYWENSAASQATFQATLADDPCGRRYLRTGDTGVLIDGQLFVAGRIKDMIIVRGRKIYPQDVEAIVEQALGRVHANYVAAFGVEADDGESLGVLVEADKEMAAVLRAGHAPSAEAQDTASSNKEPAALVSLLRQAISEALDIALHSLYFVRRGTFPRTSSGKVQRSACKMAATSGECDLVFSWHASKTNPIGAPHDPAKRNLLRSDLPARTTD